MLIIQIDTSWARELFDVRTWRRICKVAMEAMGRHWHKRMLPSHFEQPARGRYGYQARERWYDLAKHQRGIHADLIGMGDHRHESGQLREAVTDIVTFRAYPTRVTIKMTGPSYLRPNPEGKRKRAPNMVNEILAITEDERSELIQVGKAEFDRLVFEADRAAVGRHL